MLLDPALIEKITKGIFLKKPATVLDIKSICFDTRIYQDEDVFLGVSSTQIFDTKHLENPKLLPVKLFILEKAPVHIQHASNYLIVKNSLQALTRLAKHRLKTFSGKILAVTGSSGKTSFKYWVSEVLSKRFRIHYSPKSYNNKLGIAITAIECPDLIELLVLEVGTNALGDIAELNKIIKPHFVVLLNVGMAHLGRFGSLANTYKAKQEIFTSLRDPKLAFIPAGDEKIVVPSNIKKIYFGSRSKLYNCILAKKDSQSLTLQRLSLTTRQGKFNFNTELIGSHIPHVLSAIVAVCTELGLSNEIIKEGLLKLTNLKGRLNIIAALNNSYIIDDSYNANPNSIVNLLNTLSIMKFSCKTVVIGDLAELEGMDQAVASFIADNFPQGIDKFLIYGNFSEAVYKKLAIKTDLKTKIYKYKDQRAILPHIKDLFLPQSVVAFKASRISKIENLFKDYLI